MASFLLIIGNMHERVVVVTSGASTLEVEEPDVVIYRLVGTVEGEHLRVLREAEGRWNAGKTHLLVIVDIRAMTEATREARRVCAQDATGPNNRAIAICGGTRTLRTLVDMTVRAARFLSNREMKWRFFSDEDQSRQWLYAQRPHLIDYTKQQTIIDDRG